MWPVGMIEVGDTLACEFKMLLLIMSDGDMSGSAKRFSVYDDGRWCIPCILATTTTSNEAVRS